VPIRYSGGRNYGTLLLAQVIAKKIDLASVIDKTSYTPARLLGIPRAGFEIGDRADFAIYSKKPETIRGELLHSRCGWTPFEGHKAIFPNMVVMNGSITYLEGNSPARNRHGLREKVSMLLIDQK